MQHIINRHSRSNGQGQGMNWIRKEKRLAIYIRDGLACCYCRSAVDEGTKLTLDHLKPHSRGGTNEPKNLVTSCLSCNSARQDKPVEKFAPKRVLTLIQKTIQREIDVAFAKQLIARRGGFTAALQSA